MAKSKKAAKAPTTKKAPVRGIERDSDLPWNEKKVELFKALKKLGQSTSGEVVAATKLTPRDVRHYSYHARAAGLVSVDDVDGRGYCFSLTAKGKKVDPDKALADQLAAK